MGDPDEGTDPPARVEALWVKRAKRGPMDAVDRVEFIVRRGIAGNADLGGRRQVTVLSLDRWRAATAHLDPALDPALRRANVLVSGIDLESSRGRTLVLGDQRLEILGETRPCRLMDFARDGLLAALDARWGGGVYGRALTSGPIRLGDPVRWAQPEPDGPDGER